MRTTLNVKHTSPADLAKQLRSLAAKIDADALTPGADLKIGSTRVQVAEKRESDIRAFARAQGIPVGSRGRYSAELIEAWEKHQRLTEARREAGKKGAAARAAKRAAQAEAVSA
ncbi:Lsr2-like DNA bridging protein [Microbacterium phage Cece]|nr:Lsr2-like DNA bridging protein [Microbacterium phage Cece]UVG35335.1 Lsr2-like DNA bridging protein [Microbacterium phage Cece]